MQLKDFTDDIHGRLDYVMKAKGLTPYAFSKQLGYSRPAKLYSILKRKTKPSFDTLVTVLETYPEVSSDWLLMGKGSPFR